MLKIVTLDIGSFAHLKPCLTIFEHLGWYCQNYLSLYKTHVGSAPEMVTRRTIAGSVMSTTHLANPVINTNCHSCTSAKFCNWKQYNVSEKAK